MRIATSIAGPDRGEDAVQTACLGFLRTFDPVAAYGGVDGAYRYLAAATAHAASKLVRGDQRRLRALPPEPPLEDELHALDRAVADGADPCDLLLSQEEAAELRRRLKELPEEWQAVLVARAAGFAAREIQAALGLTERQYRKRVEKANRQLRDAPPKPPQPANVLTDR